jgi:hypothetical protein
MREGLVDVVQAGPLAPLHIRRAVAPQPVDDARSGIVQAGDAPAAAESIPGEEPFE